MRRTILLTAALGSLLAVVGCSPSTDSPTAGTSATSTPAVASPAAGSPAVAVDIEVLDFSLDPDAVSVTGPAVSLAVTNAGPTVHNVKVREGSGTVIFGTRDLRQGESETATNDLAPGTYVLFCSLPGHESLGITGSLTVTAP
jgi:plastocyanin